MTATCCSASVHRDEDAFRGLFGRYAPDGEGPRPAGRAAIASRGGDRAGGVHGGLEEPGGLRRRARLGEVLAHGHGPPPRRRPRAPRGVATVAGPRIRSPRRCRSRSTTPTRSSNRWDFPRSAGSSVPPSTSCPPSSAMCSSLMYFDGMSQSQIAERTGLPARHGEVPHPPGDAAHARSASRGSNDDPRPHHDRGAPRRPGARRARRRRRADPRRERASHGDCEECARLEAEFSETAGRLAFSLDPMPVDAAMADRILAASPAVAAEPAASVDELGERRQRRGRGWRAAVAVAAVIAVLLVAVAVVRPDRTTAIASASTTQRLVEFSGSGEGELAVAFTPGESGAVLWGSNLPDPGQDKVYEIWMIQDGTPVSGGCFRPSGRAGGAVGRREPRRHRGDGPHRRTRGLSIESVGRPREDGKPDPGLGPLDALSRRHAESFRPLNPRLPKA